MLKADNTALVIVDVQGKLAQIMDQKDALFSNLEAIVRGAKILELPIVWVEQIPDKLGPTIPQIADQLHDHQPIAKNSFSCYKSSAFVEALAETHCQNVIVAGIEAHICVYQTVLEMLSAGFHVEVITDAVSSRDPQNKQVALNKLQHAGAELSCTEMVLFELQEIAEGERFKQILSIIK